MSQIEKISSRSWLITSTAEPRAANSISARRITEAAPASTPQVGWLTTSTPGSRRISRPTMNFCRLPPDSDPAVGFSAPARTSKVSRTRLAHSSALPKSIQLRVATRSAAWCARMMFPGSVSSPTAAWPLRSSGTKAAPARRRRVGPARPIASPSIRIAPALADSTSPVSAAISSDCPSPATPAMPTTSPPRTSSDRSTRLMPNSEAAGRFRRSTFRRTGPGSAPDSAEGPCRSTQAISSPTIISAIERAVSALGSQWATTRPSRRMVAASQSALTSSSLCEM